MMKSKSQPISPDNALLRVAALCAASEQAEGDIRHKLATWGLAAHDVESIIAKLKHDNYLSEERFAHAFCRDKFELNRWGRIKIAFMMRSKGVAHDAIEAALQEIDEEEYRAVLEKLLADKWREVKGKDWQPAKAALLRFAAGRGFEPEVVYRAVERVMKL